MRITEDSYILPLYQRTICFSLKERHTVPPRAQVPGRQEACLNTLTKRFLGYLMALNGNSIVLSSVIVMFCV